MSGGDVPREDALVGEGLAAPRAVEPDPLVDGRDVGLEVARGEEGLVADPAVVPRPAMDGRDMLLEDGWEGILLVPRPSKTRHPLARFQPQSKPLAQTTGFGSIHLTRTRALTVC